MSLLLIIVQQFKKKNFRVTIVFDTDIVTCLPIEFKHDKTSFDPLVYKELSPNKNSIQGLL